MNDIGLNDCGSKIVMFADDTVLLQTGQDPRVVSNVLEKDLVTLTKYFRSLNLILNVKKTKIINYDVRIRKVSNKQALFNNDIQVDGQKIETVEKFKYLGIVIDGRLQFDVQLNSTIRNVNSKLYLQSRIRRCINNNTALIIYKSMVLPYLEYASCFLVSFRLSDKAKLQRLQNKGLKIALSKDRLFSTDLLHTEARIAYWETKTKAAFVGLFININMLRNMLYRDWTLDCMMVQFFMSISQRRNGIKDPLHLFVEIYGIHCPLELD